MRSKHILNVLFSDTSLADEIHIHVNHVNQLDEKSRKMAFMNRQRPMYRTMATDILTTSLNLRLILSNLMSYYTLFRQIKSNANYTRYDLPILRCLFV